ncbi:hypothetical protein [Metabacillus indicus]|uniref:hypothetical protein n=1 Tax=Metabacillus indicus TaxID=246786 RepID=UPI003CF1EC75
MGKTQVHEEAEQILKGLQIIADVPSIGGNSTYLFGTSTGIREAIDALSDFIDKGEPNGFPGLNELLTNLIIRYTGEITEPNNFTGDKDLGRTFRGKAGEHFVAGELFRRNAIVALPPQNTPLFDLIVTSPDGLKTAMVQVKTTTSENTYGSCWQLDQKFTSPLGRDDLFVVLVDAKSQQQYYVFAYDDLVDIVREVLNLQFKKSRKSDNRIFFALADTYEPSIAKKFYKPENLDWKAILNKLI